MKMIYIFIALVILVITVFNINRVSADDGRFKELYTYMPSNSFVPITVIEDRRYKVICYTMSRAGYSTGGISCISKKELGLK